MLTQRPSQLGLYQADLEYLDRVGRDSFYGRLAQARSRLFRDDDFASLYCPDNGRPSVPPSLMALCLVLKAHDKVSDEETVERANFDVRWCVALGLELASDEGLALLDEMFQQLVSDLETWPETRLMQV